MICEACEIAYDVVAIGPIIKGVCLWCGDYTDCQPKAKAYKSDPRPLLEFQLLATLIRQHELQEAFEEYGDMSIKRLRLRDALRKWDILLTQVPVRYISTQKVEAGRQQVDKKDKVSRMARRLSDTDKAILLALLGEDNG